MPAGVVCPAEFDMLYIVCVCVCTYVFTYPCVYIICLENERFSDLVLAAPPPSCWWRTLASVHFVVGGPSRGIV